jgi:hypothetical protein
VHASLEVADIFRAAGPAYRATHAGHLSLQHLKVMSAIEAGVSFRYKDYRRDGADRQRVMTLGTDEFIRRFLLHLLPRGFHRIRHYGLLSTSARMQGQPRARPRTPRGRAAVRRRSAGTADR